MNVEKLQAIAITLKKEIVNVKMLEIFKQLAAALTNQINSPNQQHLNTISQRLDELKKNIETSDLMNLPEHWKNELESINALDLIGLTIWNKAYDYIKNAGGFYNVALNNIQKLTVDLNKLFQALSNLETGLSQLGFKQQEIPEGKGLVSVTFPRELFNDDYACFLTKQKTILKFLKEALYIHTGKTEDIEFFDAECSDPTILLLLRWLVFKPITNIIKDMQDIYKKHLENKKLKLEIEHQYPESPDLLQSFNKAHDAKLKTLINAAVEKYIKEYAAPNLKDNTQLNERKNHLRSNFNAVLKDLNKGLKFTLDFNRKEFAGQEALAETEENLNSLETIREICNEVNNFQLNNQVDITQELEQLEHEPEEV